MTSPVNLSLTRQPTVFHLPPPAHQQSPDLQQNLTLKTDAEEDRGQTRDNEMQMFKKRRRELTLEDKVKVIKERDTNPSISQEQLGRNFDVSQAQVSRILKQRESLLLEWMECQMDKDLKVLNPLSRVEHSQISSYTTPNFQPVVFSDSELALPPVPRIPQIYPPWFTENPVSMAQTGEALRWQNGGTTLADISLESFVETCLEKAESCAPHLLHLLRCCGVRDYMLRCLTVARLIPYELNHHQNTQSLLVAFTNDPDLLRRLEIMVSEIAQKLPMEKRRLIMGDDPVTRLLYWEFPQEFHFLPSCVASLRLATNKLNNN